MIGSLATVVLDAAAHLFSDSVLPYNYAHEVATKVRLQRVRSRREQRKRFAYEEEGEPNYLRGTFLFHLQREKRAQRIGLLYWTHGKDGVSRPEPVDESQRSLDSYSFHWDPLQKNCEPSGGAGASRLGLGSIELDCLSSFLASSMKNRAVDQYHLRNQPETEKLSRVDDGGGINSQDVWNRTPLEMRITDKERTEFGHDSEPFANGSFQMQSEYMWNVTPPEFRITQNPQCDVDANHPLDMSPADVEHDMSIAQSPSDLSVCSQADMVAAESKSDMFPGGWQLDMSPGDSLREPESKQLQTTSKAPSRKRKSKPEQTKDEMSSSAKSPKAKNGAKRNAKSARRKSKLATAESATVVPHDEAHVDITLPPR